VHTNRLIARFRIVNLPNDCFLPRAMLRPWIFVGFTGNRTLPDSGLIAQRIRESLTRLESLTAHPLAAVSSAAKGADTLFVEAALQRPAPLPWTLLLPFPESAFFNENDFSPGDLARIRPLVSRAVRTRLETPHAPQSPGQRNQAFAACSNRTVDESDVLIAVWDGQPGKTGGTGSTVAYARALRKPLLWINSLTGEITEENLSKLPRRS
jgi:hypothetical protein